MACVQTIRRSFNSRWIESVIKEDLPPVLELEDALQNGVYLCKLGMSLLPGDELWKKVYDLDQSKYKVCVVLYTHIMTHTSSNFVCILVHSLSLDRLPH